MDASRQEEISQLRDDFLQQTEAGKSQHRDELERIRQDARQLQEELSTSLTEERQQRIALVAEKTSFAEQVRELRARLENQKEELQKSREELERQFQLMANRILEEKTAKFTEQNKQNLDSILTPLKERIQVFEKKVDEKYLEQSKDRAGLKEQIRQLAEMNQQLSADANQLATALKGDNKAQGNWGELVLSRVLEGSGLREGKEYKVQYTETSAEGQRLQPDVVIQLPDSKHIIVDSKVSLVAYEQLISAKSPEEKDALTRQHVDSVRAHITGLAKKDYSAMSGLNAPDFVLLFIPIEASFALALEADQALFDFAWKHKIVVVTPSTLLATLRTVSSVWKHERQIKNATDIAEEAGKMMDKFVGFAEDLEKLGKQLGTAQRTYDDSMNKLKTGRGSLIKRAMDLQEKGVRSKKQFSQNLTSEGLPTVEETEETPEENASDPHA